MKKAVLVVGVWVIASGAFAFSTQEYSNDSADQALRGFQIVQAQGDGSRGVLGQKSSANELVVKRSQTFSPSTQQYNTSYYQYYHGIRVLDGEVSVHEPKEQDAASRAAGIPQRKVIGKLVQGIDINPQALATLNTPENLAAALADAKSHFLKNQGGKAFEFQKDSEQVSIVIKNQGGKLLPLYEARFYAMAEHHTPIFYHTLMDPKQNNKVIKAWNDVMSHTDSGAGGNKKTGIYHYGINGIPALDVNKTYFGKCELLDKSLKLRVVNMDKKYLITEWFPFSLLNYFYKTPFKYVCESEERDGPVNGAYSPANDAYFFGQLVQRLYNDWYQTKILGDRKIILRVHFALTEFESMENAFWDSFSHTMNFGDGSASNASDGFYPLVSLDVTGHEMSHGFTSEHANLQYHDESGSLNEAYSDMAGVAATAYLQQEVPALYKAIYHTPDMVWGIGNAIMKDPDPDAALRYMNTPSRDGMSADCYKRIAGADKCLVSYDDVVAMAQSDLFPSETTDDQRQGFVVHHGSGVYNKFFYLLATTPGWDVKKAFGLMLVSNRDGYWGENTDFQSAACQTLLAANDLGYETVAVSKAFKKVGIDTVQCTVK